LSRTFFSFRTVDALAPTQILTLDKNRIGVQIVNRSWVANQIWLGFSDTLLSAGLPNSGAITIFQNEGIALLDVDGDDCTKPMWAQGFALGYVDIIETMKG
jgi:hypothetical protein